MSELLPCPTSFVPVHPKALAFLKDAALIKSGLGKLSLYSLKKIGLTDDECTAVMYIYGIAEAFDFPCAPPTPTPEGAKDVSRDKLAPTPDKPAVEARHWKEAMLGWLNPGEINKIERRATELAGGG